LRHLYATLALEAGVPIAELKFLLNHAVSGGGVTMGYLHPSLDHLQGWQEKVTARILWAASFGMGAGSLAGSSRIWLVAQDRNERRVSC
jgi:hypothetical protein